ncbi:DJ-1/PfpI family protein [Speluncibacter jeojiensis]|uniref:DJ-1/PfpI family protein n=1 Tax=Speluncibacter jeojiensis TaxID=2710754 RepID=A0A9X4M2L3_9ACTN|nr:DJ-1/PfpI family protein [Rhodococcus sp. D2-41]MDG3016674.1 DJ-1/PfpI family protein [Corynebacteriales bacterium D3-21]
MTTTSYRDAATPDVVLVPGGIGTRALAADDHFLGWLRDWAAKAEIVASVCTASGVLAAAGLLDGYRATSNKIAFEWVSGQGDDVEWVYGVQWVHDGDRWTSSGVAADIDMTGAFLAELFGPAEALRAAHEIEYEQRQTMCAASRERLLLRSTRQEVSAAPSDSVRSIASPVTCSRPDGSGSGKFQGRGGSRGWSSRGNGSAGCRGA